MSSVKNDFTNPVGFFGRETTHMGQTFFVFGMPASATIVALINQYLRLISTNFMKYLIFKIIFF